MGEERSLEIDILDITLTFERPRELIINYY